MIIYVDNTFDKLNCNPFDANKPYDNKWIMIKLIESANFKLFTGGGKDGVFSLVITKENPDWQYKIFDFIQYEESHDYNIIVAVNSTDMEIAKSIYGGHSYKDNFLRSYENKILMHSTSEEGYKSIMIDHYLKSWNKLKIEKKISEERPIGGLLGDPLDYSDYIMFNHGGKSAERVISSKQKGYVEMNLDIPYIAGARLYFDCEKIAKDGLIVRDGAHLKVKDYLPVDKYLLWIATPENLGISKNTTPRIFAEKADKIFCESFGIILPQDTRT